MASGKKNYFRHSFTARHDTKLRLLRDAVGSGFYFYFFALLELCGEQSEDGIPSKYSFHMTTLRELYGVSSTKVIRIVGHLNDVQLISQLSCEKLVSFTIPNFAKYLGKYTNKIDSNTSNKKKGKEIKGKERKVNEKKDFCTDSDLIEYWNEVFIDVEDIRTHKIDKSNIKKVNDALLKKSQYSFVETKQAILNYREALSGWFSFYWPLWTFLERKKNTQFFPDEYARKSFMNEKQCEDSEFKAAQARLSARLVKNLIPDEAPRCSN